MPIKHVFYFTKGASVNILVYAGSKIGGSLISDSAGCRTRGFEPQQTHSKVVNADLELSGAEIIANDIKNVLSPYCKRIVIAGSIRRKRPVVQDMDILVLPSDQEKLAHHLMTLGSIKIDGKEKFQVKHPHLSLDIYIATPESWATMLLVRTGSKEFINQLRQKAKDMGMKLCPDGSGLFRLTDNPVCPENRVACDTEESIFAALGMPYKLPEEREHRAEHVEPEKKRMLY